MSYSDNTQNKDVPTKYLHNSVAERLGDIAEILVEWYSLQKGSISDFLHEEGLIQFVTEEDFIKAALRKLYFSNAMIALIHRKQPFGLSLQRLYHLNSIIKDNYDSSLLVCNNTEVWSELKNLRQSKKADKQKRKSLRRLKNIEREREKERFYGATYREKHRQELRERGREYYAHNLEKSRVQSKKHSQKYRETHREEILAKNKERYYKNIDKNREQAREMRKKTHRKNRFINKTGSVILSLLNAISKKQEASKV